MILGQSHIRTPGPQSKAAEQRLNTLGQVEHTQAAQSFDQSCYRALLIFYDSHVKKKGNPL